MFNWIVFNSDSMPDRMLSVKYTINNDIRYHDLGAITSQAKENLARAIAQKITCSDTFFHVREIPTEQLTEVSGNCVVLTLDEWRTAMEGQFKRGRDCGMGMVPDNKAFFKEPA